MSKVSRPCFPIIIRWPGSGALRLSLSYRRGTGRYTDDLGCARLVVIKHSTHRKGQVQNKELLS